VRRLARPRRVAAVLILAIAASVVLSGQSSAVNEVSSISFQPVADEGALSAADGFRPDAAMSTGLQGAAQTLSNAASPDPLFSMG